MFYRRDRGVAAPPQISTEPMGSTTASQPAVGYTDEKYDQEKGPIDTQKYETGPRRGSRIDAPIRKGSIVPGDTSSDDESMNVAKQIELEQHNAIKYRTCSWPKVLFQHLLECT